MHGEIDYRDARHRFPAWARNAEQRARCILDSIRDARIEALELVGSKEGRAGLQPMGLSTATLEHLARISAGQGVTMPRGFRLTIVAMPAAVAGIVATQAPLGGPPRTGATVAGRRRSLRGADLVDLELWVYALPPRAAPAPDTIATTADAAAALAELAEAAPPLPPEIRARMDADRAAAEAERDAAPILPGPGFGSAPPDPAPGPEGGERG